MALQIAKGHIYGLDAQAPFAQSDLAGYASPKLETLRLGHNSDADRIKNKDGNTESLIFADEYLECTFEVVPEGATIAAAKTSAGLPLAGQAFSTSGLQVIAMGSWTDALNVTSGDPGQNPWIYEGGGQISGFTDGKWTLTLPLRRYVDIAAATAIS